MKDRDDIPIQDRIIYIVFDKFYKKATMRRFNSVHVTIRSLSRSFINYSYRSK